MAKQSTWAGITIPPNQLKEKRMRNSKNNRFAGMNHEEEAARVATDVAEFLKHNQAQHFECGASVDTPEEERVPHQWTDFQPTKPNVKSY